MILSIAIIKGFKTEIQDKVRGFIGDIQIYRFDLNGSFEKAPFTPNDTTLKSLKNNPQITSYYPFAVKPAIITANNEVEGINFKGIDAQYDWTFISKHLLKGKTIDFSANADKSLLISNYTANRLKLKLGDKLVMHFIQNPPRRRLFTIVGIYDIGIENLDKSFVIGDINIIKRLNNWNPTEMGGIEVRIKDFSKLKQTGNQVYENLELKLRARTVEESSPEIFSWLSLLDVNTKVLLVLMMIVGVINMVTALLIMILERTTMIGVLKSMGFTNFRIIKIFLYNALYLVGIGLVLGNILGLGLGFAQQHFQFFKLEQTSYYLKYVPVEIHFLDVAALNLATVIVCTLVLILPALLISRVSPAKAIRFK